MTSPAAVVVSGHMVDTPDRPRPRFPPDQVGRVSDEVRAALARWDVGPGTTLVCGGARGADIIAAEESLARGAHVLLCLALEPDEFVRRSVELPGSDWADRFRALIGAAEVRVLGDGDGGGTGGDDVFARTNEWMIEVARSLAGGAPHALIVWNGEGGDGPGGTVDFVRRLGYHRPSPEVEVVDPTRRAYEARQRSAGPKRLLALDGGGMRGVLSLEVLAAIETQLRRRLGDGLVLADYFDYIGGTSTGAIIATGLALGRPVAELQRAYETLGRRVFRRRFAPMRLRSIYRDGPVTEALDDLLGEGRTLGDPELRSLLLLVLHNTVTDSPWPLSSCTQAKYNRAERLLNQPSDRNLDLPLTTLIRGSTAAPLYFPSQDLQVGARRFVFQDGGITPFNNPGLLLFLMATLREYGLQWPVGRDQLLVVSVGTGSSAAVHPGLVARRVNLLFNARNLPSVFMNGSSIAQDVLCRSLGLCRSGAVIDREIGDRVGAGGLGGRDLFTYARYDADLSSEALTAFGIVGERQHRRLRKLDAVDAVPQLRNLGQQVAATVDVDTHFAGFLSS